MYRVPNLAPQSLVAFASMVSNTGCRLPGELDMICSTSEVAACCSSASTSFFCTSARALRLGLTRVLAFALFERSTRACVLLFAPLRDKITSSEVVPGVHLDLPTAGRGQCRTHPRGPAPSDQFHTRPSRRGR